MNQRANKETESDLRWQQVQARDKAADGAFHYSVASTGVYCKPSCASRVAGRENVAFHKSCKAAEKAGFRPCKRCKPNQPNLAETHANIVAECCRMIEANEQTINLETLANKVGLSPHHFHRIFKAVTGLTPKAYSDAHRAQKVRTELTKKTTVTDAIFEAGYNSNSRFYEKSSQLLGMTPSDFKAGGSNATIRFALSECSLGAILVASSALGVCAISLGDNPEKLLQDLQNTFPKATIIGADRDYETLVAKVVGFIETPAIGLDLPLDISGTAFQQRVWQALRAIPAGEKISYAKLAEKIGQPKAARAVASACAANKIAMAIPCHRVVSNDGSISGYRWGVARKANLLKKEAKS
jgi:AraC family transcriptional regulator, regulatory protein of adaptative response / methylated-DNA-[protein]-cysteine methyltransferase